MIIDQVDETNFLLYAAKHYDNPHCYDTVEFYEDLNRFKYIKRLLNKYEETGELRERLILNHLIILYNVFGDTATKMLFYKLDGYYSYLVPFLVLLHRLPEKIVLDKTIFISDIPLDNNIVQVLGKI